MKLQFYVEKLEKTKQFQEFKEKNPTAYLCAFFAILDFEQNTEQKNQQQKTEDKNSYQLDYYLEDGKIATFNLITNQMIIAEQPIKKKLEPISKTSNIDTEQFKGIVEDEMKNRIITENIKKIIATFQKIENSSTWNLQCFLENLNVLNVHLDDKNSSILKMQKYSILDIIKKPE